MPESDTDEFELYLVDLRSDYERLTECREQVEITRRAIKGKNDPSDRLANVIGTIDTMLDRKERLIKLYAGEPEGEGTRTLTDLQPNRKKQTNPIKKLWNG